MTFVDIFVIMKMSRVIPLTNKVFYGNKMTAPKISANFAPVKLGKTEIEGLQTIPYNGQPKGYYISVQQAASLFSVRPDNAQRDFKRLLGKGSRFVHLWVIRDATKISNNSGHQGYDNAMTIEQFSIVMIKLAVKGNKEAQNLQFALVGTLIETLFDDAFKVKYEEERTQARMIKYDALWETLRGETAEGAVFINNYIQHYCYDRECPEKEAKYRITFYRTMCMGLFGKYPCQIAVELGIDGDEQIYTRNFMNNEALERINLVQDFAVTKMEKQDFKPFEAIKAALAAYNFDVIDYRKE